MSKKYSQLKAAMVLAKASLIATLRSPTSVVFALLFPIIFVTVFGAMVDSTAVKVKIVLSPHSDTSSPLYTAIKKISIFNLEAGKDSTAMLSGLKKGRIAGILHIHPPVLSTGIPRYDITLLSAGAAADKLPLIAATLEEAVNQVNKQVLPNQPAAAHLEMISVPGRIYRQIDFILPGQLGFSLLMAGVFGSAFLLFNLRHTLVLKRIFVTPITRPYLLLGEMISRLLFQVLCFMIITALGYFVFDFTLVNGIVTFLEMMLLSVLGLIIFMGIGFIISGLIRNESSIAPVANTLTVPQILLCGLFFPVENYPTWLRSFCELLPLTFFVDGLRKIAFEGLHIWQIPGQVAGLLIWSIVIAFLSIRLFKWE
ncbi:ABC transporter permease [Chitinophaga nivalis]|uniref:Transport permease protein n=1 Tax=Chitinophaga nivalis TaxID=2991709 RepID=A0ABT3INB3_9BACT|nr:ABC transporter permease [Chitinophaga nivalis]MCW3464859.1 ABC transporter permease [Chitinophaga nivalis]MCW3485450.1 ABC transporter permease [Chitinophaga nivalis]